MSFKTRTRGRGRQVGTRFPAGGGGRFLLPKLEIHKAVKRLSDTELGLLKRIKEANGIAIRELTPRQKAAVFSLEKEGFVFVETARLRSRVVELTPRGRQIA